MGMGMGMGMGWGQKHEGVAVCRPGLEGGWWEFGFGMMRWVKMEAMGKNKNKSSRADKKEKGYDQRLFGRRKMSSWTPNRPRNVLSAAEQDSHNQRMGKPDLDTVHDPVARTLEDGFVVMESRVVEDSLEGGHRATSSRKVETSRSRFVQSSDTAYSVVQNPARESVLCFEAFEVRNRTRIRNSD
jgi:hypothetical protein